MFRIRSAVVGATLLVMTPGFVQAQGKSKTHATPASREGSGTSVTVVFRDPDRTVFRDYFFRNKLEVKPLPPGIAKNLARGKPLPPGIAKQVFPRTLIVRPGMGDVVFIMVGRNMVALRNGVIVDMMVNVFP